MTYKLGIVAHATRAAAAHKLMETVGAAYLSMDNGTLGCTANHAKVWSWLAKRNSEWSCVLEDDAIPCDNFRDQLAAALDTAPTPIVSLYLGTGHPIHAQDAIKTATTKADEQDANWIVGPRLLHAVAVAIRTELVTDMLAGIDADKPIDDAITAWTRKRHQISYTWPSLVSHTDGESVITGRRPRQHQRVAWRTGTRDGWNDTSVKL